MNLIIRNIIRFSLFILFQVYVLNKVPTLHQFVKPYIYFLFILWLPFRISRFWLLIISFVFGLCFDFFTATPGWHAAACVLIAYIRPFLLTILLPQESTELTYAEPSIKSMGFTPYGVYILLLTFIHHAYMVFIQWIQFGNFLFFLGKVAATTAASLVLIIITELLFARKAKYKTNLG